MDKLNALEEWQRQKADVKRLEALKARVEQRMESMSVQLEDKSKQMVEVNRLEGVEKQVNKHTVVLAEWGRKEICEQGLGVTLGSDDSGCQRWDLYIGPMHQPRERRGVGRCLQCMCKLCRIEEGTVGMSNLSGISKHAPSTRGLLYG